MPRELREKMTPWAGASVAVFSLAALLRGAMVSPDLDTQLAAMTGAWLVLALLHQILPPRRRYSGHWLVQYGAMAGYYLHLPLAVYAVNTVRYSSDTGPVHVAWCSVLPLCSCFLLLSGPLHSAYALGDGPFRGLSFLNALYCFFSLSSLGTKLGAEVNGTGGQLSYIIIGMLIATDLMLVTLLGTVVPCLSSRRNSITVRKAKACADWMKEEANSPASPFFGGHANSSSSSSKYPVVLQHNYWMMIERDMNHLSTHVSIMDGTVPDFVLSRSFALLLGRRYFGLDCAEEGNAKLRDFVLMELMQPPDYLRAFAIVQEQLALLHDEYFTVYSSSTAILALIALSAFSLSAVLMPSGSLRLTSQYTRFCVVGLCSSVVVAGTICMQLLFWGGNHIAPSIRGSNRFSRPHWKNEIGQYSLIQDYDSRSITKRSLFLLKGIISTQWPPIPIKHHPVEEDAVALPDSVRICVARTLRDINGPPTNGIRSLQRNRARIEHAIQDDLSWTCKQDTHTHTILIWHIATFYCGMSPPEDSWEEEIRSNYQAATALSRYCAYLVAFLPEFLPEHKLTTQTVFEQVLDQAQHHLPLPMGGRGIWNFFGLLPLLGLRERMSSSAKIGKIRGLRLAEEEGSRLTTFEKGVKLGRQLERLGLESRWEVMAEFWAETILYIAPSDNASLHFKHLAQGGEFVTHLWAMLSNAGILKRAKEEEVQQPELAALSIEELATRLEATLAGILEQAREEEMEMEITPMAQQQQPEASSTSSSGTSQDPSGGHALQHPGPGASGADDDSAAA